jgi:hypothetical protein
MDSFCEKKQEDVNSDQEEEPLIDENTIRRSTNQRQKHRTFTKKKVYKVLVDSDEEENPNKD